MSRFTVLITNDDGHESPLLVPFIKAVAARPWCGELRIVVPAREQSWIAKGITRFEELKVSKHNLGSHEAFYVTGTPADCVSLGIHNLYPNKPDLVLSGINIGMNSGLAFFFSSGTVGGAFEAALTRVRGFAFSGEMTEEVFEYWRHRNWEALAKYESQWVRLAELCVDICSELITDGAAPASSSIDPCEFYSVNIPWDAKPTALRTITYLQPTYYGRLFTKDGPDTFIHRMENIEIAGAAELKARGFEPQTGDMNTLARGEISITPIRFSAGKFLSVASPTEL